MRRGGALGVEVAIEAWLEAARTSRRPIPSPSVWALGA